MPPRTLIVGADGLIGAAVMARHAATGMAAAGTSRIGGPDRLALDLGNLPPTWTPPPGVDVAILCAAMTRQADCDRDPELARRVNVEATARIAEALAAAGAFVIFLSTSLVFDGATPRRRPDEPVAPQGTYACLKAAAEARLLDLGAAAAVVRITKVLGPATALIRGWIDLLRRGEPVRPFHDMVLAPLSPAFVAAALERVAVRRAAGIVHVSAAADITYADAARHLAGRLGVPPGLVQPVSRLSAGIPDTAAPAHTTLDTRRMVEDLGLAPPAPYDALDELLDALQGEADA